jgi:cell division protein FtsX
MTVIGNIDEHTANFQTKMQAHNELESLDNTLNDLDTLAPKKHKQLQDGLTQIEKGASTALQLAKKVKDGEEMAGWLIEKAPAISAVLAAIPIM